MNDLLPHKHGDEGSGSTHSACNTRILKCDTRLAHEGYQAQCCACVPHDGCDYYTERPNPHLDPQK